MIILSKYRYVIIYAGGWVTRNCSKEIQFKSRYVWGHFGHKQTVSELHTSTKEN